VFSQLWQNMTAVSTLAMQMTGNSLKDRPVFPDAKLRPDQLEFFRHNGYVTLEKCVTPELVSYAKRLINRRLGEGLNQAEAPLFKNHKAGLGFWPKDSGSAPIMNLLYESPLATYAQSLLGNYHRVHFGQIALRFPGDHCVRGDTALGRALGASPGEWLPQPNFDRSWHVDGLPRPGMKELGMDESKVMQFTLLVGVMLSDVPEDNSGNLMVWPGGHLKLQSYVLERNDPRAILETSLLDQPPDIPLDIAPTQICLDAGDAVVCHWMLPHSIAPNLSPNIRYAVYFRLTHARHTPGTFCPEAMSDVWLEFDSIRSLQ